MNDPKMPSITARDIARLAERDIEWLKDDAKSTKASVSNTMPNKELLVSMSRIEERCKRIRELVEYIDANLPERA